MSLPGKLCIGLIEEDNPQKSYFRLRPILVAENGEFVRYELGDEFPENGCIRIVPDKNESSRFKARMRRMGGYCVLDLRSHINENDKIRPNKNYHGEPSEQNAYIVYSDVIKEPIEGSIVEVVSQEAPSESEQLALSLKNPPRTNLVLMLNQGTPASSLWSHARMDDIEGGVAFTKAGIDVDLSTMQRINVPIDTGETLDIMIVKPDMPIQDKTQYKEDDYTDDFSQGETEDIRKPCQDIDTEEKAFAKPLEKFADKPFERPINRFPTKPVETYREPAEKPWLFHDDAVAPRPVEPGLSPREAALAMQRGINPRRGKSLQEIIDDKWRQSRFDQLGQPVEFVKTGKPIVSPVDKAIDAMRDAWGYVNARPVIARALTQMSGVRDAILDTELEKLNEEREAQKKELEDIRTSALSEINAIKNERDRVKGELLDEMRAENQKEITEQEERVKELERYSGELMARAEDAKRVTQNAERSIAELTDERLTQRLADFAVTFRAADMLANLRGGCRYSQKKFYDLRRIDKVSVTELTQRVCSHFAEAGIIIGNDEAVNVIACLCTGRYMLITGPSGSGKTVRARLLIEALGATPLDKIEDINSPRSVPVDLPEITLADDINVSPRCSEQLIPLYERRADAKLIMTAQDSGDGYPIGARLLDRAFMIRIEPNSATSPWENRRITVNEPDGALTTKAIAEAFMPKAENVTSQVAQKLSEIRGRLARYNVLISRRTLDELWLYCASATPYFSMSPMEVFDLAFSQRALPSILCLSGLSALHAMPEILYGMPRCLALLRQPLSIDI